MNDEKKVESQDTTYPTAIEFDISYHYLPPRSGCMSGEKKGGVSYDQKVQSEDNCRSDDDGCCGCIVLILALIGLLYLIGAFH